MKTKKKRWAIDHLFSFRLLLLILPVRNSKKNVGTSVPVAGSNDLLYAAESLFFATCVGTERPRLGNGPQKIQILRKRTPHCDQNLAACCRLHFLIMP